MAFIKIISVRLLLLVLYVDKMNAENASEIAPDINLQRRSAVLKGQGLVVVEEVEILQATNIELLCNLTDISNMPLNITGYWMKDGEIDLHQDTVQRKNSQYFLNRTVTDLGNYSCIFSYLGKKEMATFILKVPTIKEKRDKPIVSYIGDTVTLSCEIKHEPNTWKWYKVNNTEKVLINATDRPQTFEILPNGNVTKLKMFNLSLEDSGTYICSVEYPKKVSELHMELKVLSFTEPLKPFLAIAAEVIILVLVILLYEHRSHSQESNSTTVTGNGVNFEQISKLTQEDTNGVEEATTRQRKV
ncbi:embigin [Chanos chanos]|uniref:Embigin n=1 Tax=Chanos chanos TaxID=29144 RepID=A0A6J2WU10_CHACN|nr:embigin [Chanos chanos]